MNRSTKIKLEELDVLDHLKIKNSNHNDLQDCRKKAERRARSYNSKFQFLEVKKFLEDLDDVKILESNLIYNLSEGEMEPCQLEITCDPQYGKILGPEFFWQIRLEGGKNLRYCPSCLIDSFIYNEDVVDFVNI